MEVDNIRKFLETNYTDEQLTALLTHTECGKLSFYSCCCLRGVPGATHALMGVGEYGGHIGHFVVSKVALLADHEFFLLGMDENGGSDTLRRERLLPLIREEIERRGMKALNVSAEFAEVS